MNYPTPPVVRAEGLTKRYGSRLAVDRISFELPPGTVTGFVGPNGAGKTTTIRMLLGLVGISQGRAHIGTAPVDQPGALDEVGALIEGPAFYPGLSARRNLAVLAAAGGVDRRRLDQVLDLVGLTDRSRDPVRSFSLGMRQRLGIGAALLSDPRVLMLDEPTNGLDPAGIREIRALVRRLADGGVTVLVSSHLLAEIEQVSDRLLMIRQGRLVFSGAMAEIARHRRTLLVVGPESSGQLRSLVELLAGRGLPAVPDDDGLVRVDTVASRAAEVNREAFGAGIVLRELRVEVEDLEATFFRMLDLDETDATEETEAGAATPRRRRQEVAA